ncbi:hypothetical protein [Lysobacter humi (ex Lee et al. 2017)]
MRTRSILLAALLATVLPAQADEPRFALVCIGTVTDYPVNFDFRWEGGDWEATSVAPGGWKLATWPYTDEDTRAPTPQVRYDDDLGDDVHRVVTDLSVYAADTEDCEGEGATYDFHERDGELFIGSAD